MAEDKLVFLAPMAGVTDRAFREIAAELGADRTFTEMVSCKGLYYNDKKTAQLLRTSDAERPVAVQIFGHEPEIMSAVIDKALAFGGDYLDINCGCPANKIISNGDGGALMKSPKLIGDIVRSVTRVSRVPVSVKIRKGWNESSINAVETAKIAEDNGAAMITVHGRTVTQGYSGAADWDIIARVKEAVSVPVIGNGDIFTSHDAGEMLEHTGCDGVMLGRGILGNPFLVRNTVEYLRNGILPAEPSKNERIAMAKRHIALIIKYKGEYTGIREARKHALWYIKGLPNVAKVKNLVSTANTYDEMCTLLDSLRL